MPESSLEPKYTLFDSVERMLAPETLGKLLAQPVTLAHFRPMNGHNGLAGSELSYLDTSAGRFVLKRMSIVSDWMMLVTDDFQGRSARLWQYGLLDQLLPAAEHKIIAASRDGDGWAILMNDLTGKFFSFDDLPPQYVPAFLDTLAQMHATFWNDPRLRNPRLGLGNAATALNFYFRSRNHTGDAYGVIPHWCRDGWKAMPDLLDAGVFRQMVAFHEDPAPLLDAIRRYPSTLLHGDYRAENLAHNGTPVVVDWQQAKCSLMTIDLAWFVKNSYVQSVMSREEATTYYRERLQASLDLTFEDSDWDAMVALGFAVDALATTCLFASFYHMFEDPDAKAWNLNMVRQQGQMVMDVLRWL